MVNPAALAKTPGAPRAHCSDHLLDCISSVDDFKDSLRKEHTLSEEELLDKVKAGILNGFLELVRVSML